MKLTIPMIALFMSVTSCNAQTNRVAKTMLEEFNLRGKVKTLTYHYGENSHTLHFNEYGMLIKQENVYMWEGIRGELYDNYIYENGRLQSYDVYRVFESGPNSFIGKVWFEYNTKGLLASSDSDDYEDKVTYKYDRKGNRIERYGRLLKSRQKFNQAGQVTEEWYFEDKETETRAFGITDAQGNHLPDEIYMRPGYELAPKVYENNQFGDVVSIKDMSESNPVATTITLKYDDKGNWTERIDHGDAMHYLTTEEIYTRQSLYGEEHVRRVIEYYE